MSQIGALSIAITADGNQAVREMGNVDQKQKKTFSDLGKNLRNNANQWAKWGAAAAAAAAVASAAIVRASMNANRELIAQSIAANSSVEDLQRLAFASETVGISQEKLADILKDTNDRVGDFISTGAGPMADFFEKIAPQVGVTIDQFRSLSGPQALQLYVSSLEKANLSQAEMTFYMEAMASDSTRLIPLLRNNGEQMSQFADQADRLGVVLSEVDSGKIEDANVAISQAASVLQGRMMTSIADLSPVLTQMAEQFITLSQESEDFGNVTESVFSGIVYAVGKTADVFRGWQLIVKSIEAAFHGLSIVVSSSMAAIANAINSTMQFAAGRVNALITDLNKVPGVDLNEIVVGESEFANKMEVAANSARVEFADAMFELRNLASEPLPSEQFNNFVDDAREAAEQAGDAISNALEPVTFSPIVISNNEAISEIHAALRTAEGALEASYQEQTAIVVSERQKRLDVIENYNQQEEAMLSAQSDAAEYQSQADDIRTKKQQELIAIEELEAAKEAALHALPAVNAYTSQAEWIREKKEEELTVIEQLEAAKAHMLETGAGDEHIANVQAQLDKRLEAFQNYAQQEQQVLGMISEAQTFGGVEMDLETIEAQLAARLELIADYNQREQELAAQVREAEARGGSEEELEALRAEREATLEQIQYYNDLELQLQEQHEQALRAIVQGDDKYSMESNEAWLNGLRERNMTELELIDEQYNLEHERLVEALEQELVTREEYGQIMADLESKAAKAREKVAEEEAKNRSAVMGGMMQNLSGLMNSGSKKMFAIGKAAAIAQALIAGKEAVVNSYNAGSRIGGPPVGAAFAATAAAATASQINQIRSQSFGGGGNPTTYSGGLPAVRTTQAGAGGTDGPVNPSQRVDINITGTGNSFSAEQVRDLIRQINDQVGDGVNLAFGG